MPIALGVLSCAILSTGVAAPQTHGGQPAAAPRRVFILHSFGPEVATFVDVASTFRAELVRVSPQPIEFYEAALETARFREQTNESPLVAYLDSLFAERSMDLFVAIGGPAAMFALRQHEHLLPATPLLVTGAEQRQLAQAPVDPNAATIPAVLDLPGIIDGILHLLPETSRIVVVLGASPFSEAWLPETRRAFAPFTNHIEFTWANEWPLEEMRRRLAALPPNSAIFFAELYVDAAGIPYSGYEVLESLHEVANAPIFGILEAELGHGVVGGSLLSEAEAGHQTAAVALRILNGTPPAEVPTTPITAGDPVYDFRELERWGIDESRLPPGSTIRFRPSTLWDRYRAPLLAGLGVIALQAALIGGLLVQRRRRRIAEEEARTFGRRLLTAHEDERRLLARELHDDLTQRLARLSIDTARLQKALAGSPEAELGKTVRDDLARLGRDVHAIARQLHPSILDDLGLQQALELECEQFTRREPIAATLDSFDAPADLPPSMKTCLYRIAQEALHNAARHAHADAVRVTVTRANGALRLSVRDDGKGFDPTDRSPSNGIGLISMRERAELVHGELEIRSAPGRGTTVVVSVPLGGGYP